MNKHLQASEENTKTIIESNQQLTKTLAEVHSGTSRNFLDPNTSDLRQKLAEDLQRENFVLTVSGCTETQEGAFKTIVLPRETKFTTVTFKSKIERDLFSGNVDKKVQTIKFFNSHPQTYRQPNKDMRKTAGNLREMGYITDISIDETSLVMFLK